MGDDRAGGIGHRLLAGGGMGVGEGGYRSASVCRFANRKLRESP